MSKKEMNKKVDLQQKEEKKFVFSKANQERIKEILSRYPKDGKHSAVMPLLWLAQEQNKESYVPVSAMDHIAELLEMPPIKVYEVATFYSMYNKKPIGKYFIQICATTPCWLRGSDQITEACESHLNIKKGETTKDGMFTLKEVQCLGACANAPMIQINKDFYEDLDEKSMIEILKNLKAGKRVKPGSQIGRTCSAPVSNTDKTPSN